MDQRGTRDGFKEGLAGWAEILPAQEKAAPQKLRQRMRSTLRMGQQESTPCLLGPSPALSSCDRAKSRAGPCLAVQGQKRSFRHTWAGKAALEGVNSYRGFPGWAPSLPIPGHWTPRSLPKEPSSPLQMFYPGTISLTLSCHSLVLRSGQ